MKRNSILSILTLAIIPSVSFTNRWLSGISFNQSQVIPPKNLVVSDKNFTLKKALEIALKNNLEIQSAYENFLVAKYKFFTQISQRFGEVSFFWKYTQYKFPRMVAPLEPPLIALPVDDQVRNYGFQYKVRLFDGCQQFFLIKAKQYEKNTSFIKYIQTRHKVKEKVKELYFQILIFKAQKKALIEQKKATEKLYETVYESYKLGKKPLLDLLNIKAKLREIQAQIQKISAEISSLKNELSTLLNKDISDYKFQPVKIKVKILNKNSIVKEILKRNLDIKILQNKKEEIEAYKKVALAEFSPKVDFIYTTQKYVYGGHTTSDWFYGINISFPLFDFGKRFFSYKSAQAQQRQIEKERYYLIQEIINQAKGLVEKLNAQYYVISAYKDKLKFYKEAYKIEKEKYWLGKSDIYNLLQAQALYYTAMGDYEASIYQWAILKAKLDYLLSK
jgi:outer membrane protein TolC